MNLSVLLIVYVAITIISGVMKKMAEEKTRGQQAVGHPGSIGAEVRSFEELEPSGEISEDSSADDFTIPTDFDSDSEELVVERSRTTRESISKQETYAWQLDAAQAVVMSEIIREPRSKRPWPNR